MFTFYYSNKFKKDFKVCTKRNYDFLLLTEVLGLLEKTGDLPTKYKPHKLKGEYSDCWECHIKSDWLLIWRINEKTNEIELARTGTHSDLF